MGSPRSALETFMERPRKVTSPLLRTYGVVRPVLDGRQGFREAPRAGSVAGTRHGHADALVWAAMVVDRPPRIEGLLHVCVIDPGAPVEDLGFQAAVEAFVLAVGLRMDRCAEADLDAEPDQPQAQGGQAARIATGTAPRRAVVHVHARWQAVVAGRSP